MAVTPGTNGHFSRTTNIVDAAVGYSWCCWLRITGNATNFDNIWQIDHPTSGFLGVYVNNSSTAIRVADLTGHDTAVVNPGTNTWVFLAFRQTTTTINVLNRLEGATSLSTTGNLTYDQPGSSSPWKLWLINNSAGEMGVVNQMFAFKMWNASLSDAEFWEESVRFLPRRKANLDCFLPFDNKISGVDESGMGRDWTVNNTPSFVAVQPRISRGGDEPVYSTPPSSITSTCAITLPGLDASAAAALAMDATVAVTLPGLDGAVSAALAMSSTVAVTLPGLDSADASAQAMAATVAITLDGLTVMASDDGSIGSAGTPALAGLDTAAAVALGMDATASPALAGLDAAATGGLALDAVGAAALAGLDVSGTLVLSLPSTVTVQLPGLDAAGVSLLPITCVCAITLPGLEVAGVVSGRIPPPYAGSFAEVSPIDNSPPGSVYVPDTSQAPDQGSFVGFPAPNASGEGDELDDALPPGFAYLIDEEGAFLVDEEGAFLIAEES